MPANMLKELLKEERYGSMTFLILIAFFAMIAGGFLIFGVSPKDFAETLAQPIQVRKPTMREKYGTLSKRKSYGVYGSRSRKPAMCWKSQARATSLE